MIVRGQAPTRYVWRDQTLVQQLEETIARAGDAPAIVAPEGTLTWADVGTRSRSIAKGLMARGIDAGDRVAVWLPNHTEWFLVWLAAAHIGAVAVPINTRYRAHDLEHVLRDSGAAVLFTEESFLSNDYVEILGEVRPDARTDEFGEYRFAVFTRGTGPGPSLAELEAGGAEITDAELDGRTAAVDPADTTIIIYTSGSTGFPKGVMHCHRILRQECALTEWLQIDGDSRILGHMPFFHVAGGLSALLPALISGASIVLLDTWEPEVAVRLIEEQRITTFGGIATHFVDVLSVPDLARHDLSSLGVGWMGGSMNPRDVLVGAKEKLGMKVLPVYGMTEGTSVTSYPRADDPEEILLAGKGIPISDYELKVVDLVDGRELEAGEPGEVCVRGHLVMQGYWRNPEATAATIDADGWLHSGDIGVLDEAGYLQIVGRQKEMFIVGGNNVFPADVERVLASLPGVKQVSVVPVPDERLGEVPYAFVEVDAGSNLGVEDIERWSREQLTSYRRPCGFRLLTSWPKTGSGKVDRMALQRDAITELGLDDDLVERRLLPAMRGDR